MSARSAPRTMRWFTRLQHRAEDIRNICFFALCPLKSVSTTICVGNNDTAKQLQIEQWTSLGSGGFVWSGARRLAAYLDQHGSTSHTPRSSSAIIAKRPWQGLNVIELGAGTGALGLSIAAMGANVTLTDQASFIFPATLRHDDARKLQTRSLLDLLKINVQQNIQHTHHSGSDQQQQAKEVQVREMLWGDDDAMLAGLPCSTYDVIVAADVLLFKDAQKDLLCSLRHLSEYRTIIFIEHTDRSSNGNVYPVDLLHFLDLLERDEQVPWYPKIVSDHGRHITLCIERGPTRF